MSTTYLGVVWWLLDPIMLICVYWLLFSIITGRGDGYAPYPVFVGCAVVPWRCAVRSISRSAKVYRSYRSLIQGVAFPTASLPMSIVLAEGVLFVCGMAALTAASALFGVSLGWPTLQVIPLMALQFVLLAGAGFGIAAIGGLLPDMAVALPHVLRLLFYLSPSLYGIDLVAERLGADSLLFEIYSASPVAILFTAYRDCLWDPDWIAASQWAMLAGWSVLFFACGYTVFRTLDRALVKSA
jgi:ABC-2 type transport system permease protein